MLADVKGHRRCGQTNAESIHDMGKVLLVFMDPTRLENDSVTVRSAFKDSPFGKVVAVWRGVGRVQPAIAAVPFIVVRELDPPADKGMRPLLALALLTCTGAELRVGRFEQLFRRSSWNMAASPQNWRLKPEISLSGRDFLQTFDRDVPDPLVRNVAQFPPDQRRTGTSRLFGGVVLQILLQSHQRVGMAAVGNSAAFAQRHESVARPALPVTGRTEARDEAELHQPTDDLVQCPVVADVELGRIFLFGVRRTVPADAGFRRPADLGYAEPDDLFPGGLAFAGRNDHARIGDGKPQAGADLGKCFVVDAVAELVGIDVVSPLHPGYAYGVWADAVYGFKMLRVHQQRGELVAIPFEAEQDTDAHIVDSTLHGPVHRFGMIGIIVLRPRRMELLITLLVIRFLEQNVGPDSGVLEFSVVLDGGCGYIDVDPADRPIPVFDAIYGPDAFQNVFNGIIEGILAGFYGESFMPHVLKSRHFSDDVFLR